MARKARSKVTRAKDPKRVAAGKKAAATRAANAEAARRREIALKGWETRRRRAAEAEIIIHANERKGAGAEIAAEIERRVQPALRTVMARALNAARRATPVNTGRLQSSLQITVEGHTGYLTTDVPYARWQDEGTGPKPPYRSRYGGVMRFKRGTYEYPPGFASVVENHRGNPAANFMAEAERVAADEGAELVADILVA